MLRFYTYSKWWILCYIRKLVVPPPFMWVLNWNTSIYSVLHSALWERKTQLPWDARWRYWNPDHFCWTILLVVPWNNWIQWWVSQQSKLKFENWKNNLSFICPYLTKCIDYISKSVEENSYLFTKFMSSYISSFLSLLITINGPLLFSLQALGRQTPVILKQAKRCIHC